MTRRSGAFWVKAGVICAAMVLPFGTLILTAMAAQRGLRRWRSPDPAPDGAYDAWWRLREHIRGSSPSNGAVTDGARPPFSSAGSEEGDHTMPRS